MHSCRRILFICTVQSLYYMRVYHRCFLTLACVSVGELEVGFVSACSWLALVTGVGGYILAGVEVGGLSCIFLYFCGCCEVKARSSSEVRGAFGSDSCSRKLHCNHTIWDEVAFTCSGCYVFGCPLPFFKFLKCLSVCHRPVPSVESRSSRRSPVCEHQRYRGWNGLRQAGHSRPWPSELIQAG